MKKKKEIYLMAEIYKGYDKKYISGIENLEYLNLRRKGSQLLLNRNNPEHIKVIKEIDNQAKSRLSKNNANGFMGHMAMYSFKSALELLNDNDSAIILCYDVYNNKD